MQVAFNFVAITQEMSARICNLLRVKHCTYLCSFYDFMHLLPMFFETVIASSGITILWWWVGRPAFPKTCP